MNIFVTGATGFIGKSVAVAASRAGHQVFGLTRSQAKARELEAAEVLPVVGDMGEPSTWTSAARSCDVVIHCAAEYSERYMELDRRTVQHLLSLQPKVFLYTSGCWLYGDTGHLPADETSEPHPPALVAPRLETERVVLSAASAACRTLIVRPGCVYGGTGSLTAAWFESATNEGAVRIIGPGGNHWTMVHCVDLAELYCLAAESSLSGEILNAVDDTTPTLRECAEAASRAVLGDVRLNHTPPQEAAAQMGPVVECLMLDQRLTPAKAKRLLGWQARHAGFVSGASVYYRAWKAAQ